MVTLHMFYSKLSAIKYVENFFWKRAKFVIILSTIIIAFIEIRVYNQKIQCFFTEEDKFSIFSINNRIEDLESLINQDSFYAVYFIVLEKIRVLYSKINGIIDLPNKILCKLI